MYLNGRNPHPFSTEKSRNSSLGRLTKHSANYSIKNIFCDRGAPLVCKNNLDKIPKSRYIFFMSNKNLRIVPILGTIRTKHKW